jgi:hypothetical protein
MYAQCFVQIAWEHVMRDAACILGRMCAVVRA